MGIIIMGGISVIIGIIGCCTAKCMKPCFTVPFVILATIVGFILIVFGLAMTGIGNIFDLAIDKACEATGD